MKDYNAKLYEEYTEIKRKVERGMLPLVARNPTIDRATTDYAVALAEHYHADKDAGKNPPVPLKNAALLDRFSDLVMYEELKWSHPDKMSIVEYPVMSETQKEVRNEKQTLCDDILYGDRRYTGRRKTHFTDEDGALQVRNTRMAIPSDVGKNIDLYDALENAGLTDRQRQAIDLVFFENLTQEEAAAEMGVNKSNVNAYLSAAYRKLREYLTKE